MRSRGGNRGGIYTATLMDHNKFGNKRQVSRLEELIGKTKGEFKMKEKSGREEKTTKTRTLGRKRGAEAN